MINKHPKYLYVPNTLLDFLKDNFEFDVISVTKGQKYQLLKQAKTNSIEYLRANKESIQSKDQYYESISLELKRIFNKSIKRIELFDNSHTSGLETVGAMVVYNNFKPSKKDYRLYKLTDSSDDLKSMNETLYRRYFRVLKDDLKKPDLIIVDGSKNQIKIAKDIIDSLGLKILVCGLGKNDKHSTSYLMDENFQIIDIDSKSNLFFFLTNMQDEVHRFAITYHKKLRSKAAYHSLLDDIEGIGPKTRKMLLKKYKTVAYIKQLSLEELKTCLNDKLATRLYNKIEESKNAEKFK